MGAVLSHMIAASLEEDRYGVVKRDVPRVMEALVKFMKELDVYRAELMGEADKLLEESCDGGSEETRERKEEYGRAIGVVGALADGESDGCV
jgi:nucleoporin NDC1